MLDSDTNLVVAQCVGLVLIFFSELIMGTLPMHSPTFRSSPLLMGWANSFVAGLCLQLHSYITSMNTLEAAPSTRSRVVVVHCS